MLATSCFPPDLPFSQGLAQKHHIHRQALRSGSQEIAVGGEVSGFTPAPWLPERQTTGRPSKLVTVQPSPLGSSNVPVSSALQTSIPSAQQPLPCASPTALPLQRVPPELCS